MPLRKESSLKKIQILLSTYNGEAHVREQLDSFLALDNAEEVSVFIRDDGSTDGTRAILKEYESLDGFRVIYGENVGLNASLQILFEQADPECLYYAYSDQDDVWLPEKLSLAAAALDKESATAPVMYTARSYLTDSRGNRIGVTRIPKRPPSFPNAMVQNVCIGHTQVYNRPMLALLRDNYTEGMFVTDHWAYLLVAAFGKIVYDETPTTLYRQHESNAIGYGHNRRTVLRNRFRRTLAGVPLSHAKQLIAFRERCGDRLCARDRTELDRFLDARRNFFTRLGYLFRARAHRQSFFENLGFRTLYLFGRYNEKQKTKGRSK